MFDTQESKMWQLEARVFPSRQAPFSFQTEQHARLWWLTAGHRSDSRILASASSDA